MVAVATPVATLPTTYGVAAPPSLDRIIALLVEGMQCEVDALELDGDTPPTPDAWALSCRRYITDAIVEAENWLKERGEGPLWASVLDILADPPGWQKWQKKVAAWTGDPVSAFLETWYMDHPEIEEVDPDTVDIPTLPADWTIPTEWCASPMAVLLANATAGADTPSFVVGQVVEVLLNSKASLGTRKPGKVLSVSATGLLVQYPAPYDGQEPYVSMFGCEQVRGASVETTPETVQVPQAVVAEPAARDVPQTAAELPRQQAIREEAELCNARSRLELKARIRYLVSKRGESMDWHVEACQDTMRCIFGKKARDKESIEVDQQWYPVKMNPTTPPNKVWIARPAA